MSVVHGRTFPSEHAFLQLQEAEVMSPDEPDPPPEKTIEWLKYWLFRTSDLLFIPDPRLVDNFAEYKRCKRKEEVPWKSTQDLMNILFPTRYWKEDGIRYKQKVSMQQVTRDELKAMKEHLDNQLERRQSQLNARYCVIRFSLHIELFDELIRQIALNDPMRAYMLERVKGELNQTLDAYRKVLDVSLVEGELVELKKRIEPEISHLQKRLDEAESDLNAAKEAHENTLSELKELELKFEVMERIQRQVYEPEIELTKRLGTAMERQLFHFENPPEFSMGDDDD